MSSKKDEANTDNSAVNLSSGEMVTDTMCMGVRNLIAATNFKAAYFAAVSPLNFDASLTIETIGGGVQHG